MATRVSLWHLPEKKVVAEFHVGHLDTSDGNHTCILVTQDGMTHIGKSKESKSLAYDAAFKQLWPLEAVG